MSEVSCPTCTAPVSILQASHTLVCGHCGATFPLPDHVANNAQWLRHWKQQQIEQWFERERTALMMSDSTGQLRPPEKHSVYGNALFMGFAGVGFVISAMVMFAGLLFPPLLILLPITFFAIPLIGFVWGGRHIHAARQRYSAYSALQNEYDRRVAALDAVTDAASD